jgi:nitroreductase
MELAETLRRRRMVRAYDPGRPVPEDALDAITGAALRAPSAGFTQGVSLLVLDDPAGREQFWAVTADATASADRWLRGMRSAPVLLLVWTSQAAYLDRYAEPDKGSTDRDPARWTAPYWYVDAGMASMAMLLRAVDLELAACFFGVPEDRVAAVRSALGVPEDQLSVGVVSLGYPAPGGAAGSPKRRTRRPREQLVHRGNWT